MRLSRLFKTGCLGFLGYLVLAGIGFFLVPEQGLNLAQRLSVPSSEAWLGLDENGQSLLIQIVRATYLSVSVSVLVVSISAFTGVALGLFAGQRGGVTDSVIMRAIEVLQAFPNFLLALGILSFLGSSYFNLVLAMSLTTWTGFARLIRGEVLHIKHLEFVQASKSFGSSPTYLALHHLLPQVIGLAFVHASYTAAGVVIAEAGLSFLGVGLPADVPSWGQLIQRGRPYLSQAPHIALFPSVFLASYIACFYLLGDGLKNMFTLKSSGLRQTR